MSRSLAAVIFLLLVLLTPVTAQAAEPAAYGELTRFGEGGAGGEDVNNEHVSGEWALRQHLIGVDPVENAVYVLDEPAEYTQKHRKPSEEETEECETREPPIPPSECGPTTGPVTRHFRLRRFTLQGATYKLAATVTFEETAPPSPEESNHALTVEGVAVDAKNKRVYVLAVDDRKKGINVDELREGGSNLPVASTLFAFNAETLAGAGKSGKLKEVLAGPTELQAQSATPGAALLDPTGLTVDPGNGNIIVLAHIDPTGSETDHLYGQFEKPSPDHFVLQRISSSTGEFIAEKGRYVDATNVLKPAEGVGSEPLSPVVVGPEAGEQVDVSYEGGLAGMPIEFASGRPPEVIFKPALALTGALEPLLTFGERNEATGALNGNALAASPYEAGSNTLYSPASVLNELPGAEEEANTAIVALSSPSNSLLGWTGGQSLFVPRGPGEGKQECLIDPGKLERFDPVAAGSGGKLFVFAPEYFETPGGEKPFEGPSFPAIVEFGPGGKGCPPAKGAGLAAEVNGELVGQRSVSESEVVDFSSYVNQADAKSVEWNFGDGTSEVVSNRFHCPARAPRNSPVRQCPTVEHVFRASGELTVTEKVLTDDLATPSVTQETKIKVGGGTGGGGGNGPTARPTGPREVQRAQPGVFDGSASFDTAGANEIAEYHWSFGDGARETTPAAVTLHAYAAVGSYPVLLTVTDTLGLTSLPAALERPVKVVEPPTAAPASSSAPLPTTQVGGYSKTQAPQVVPNVRLTDAALALSKSGTLTVRLYCPAGETTCAGQVTLRALVAFGTRHGRRKPVSTTLASGFFSVAGGSTGRVVLRVPSKLRAVLAQKRKLTAQVTISAHDTVGATHITLVPVLVTAPRVTRGHSKH